MHRAKELERKPGKKHAALGFAGILLLGLIVPSLGIAVIQRFFPVWYWFHPTLHTFMEALGVTAAFSLAAILLLLRREKRHIDHDIWIACGLLSVGILDAFHSVQMNDTPLIGLRCASTVTGGALFSLVWLPERISSARSPWTAPLLTVGTALMVALTITGFPDLLPPMVAGDGYTAAARAANFAGGILYAVAATYFLRRYRETASFGSFLFASLCLLFAMAGILFPLSMIWLADWWFWHFLRLAAFLHVLTYLFLVYAQTLAELKELNESLERRVTERTAQLSAEVAERRHAEEALKDSETRYRRLVESVTDYIYSVQVEGGRAVQTVHGPGCLGVTGYTPEEYAADPGLWYHMVHKEDRKRVLQQAAAVLKGRGKFRIEHRIIRKDGEMRWVKNTPVPRLDDEGRLVGYDGLISDITERKLAEEEIRTYNDELVTINRLVASCTSILDFREIIDTILKEVTRIAGLDEGSICVRNDDNSFSVVAQTAEQEPPHCRLNSDRIAGDCFFRACVRSLRPIVLDESDPGFRPAQELSPHGTDLRFHAAFPLPSPKRRCVGVLCIFTRGHAKPTTRSLRLVETVTAHVALLIENARLYEETLSHAATLEKKVAERTLELEAANSKLREIDRTKSMFIASMSHELRTPLNSVIGFSSILLSGWAGPLDDEQRENLEAILKAGELLLSLVNDVIDVSKIEAGQIETVVEDFDIHEVVSEAATALRKEMSSKGLDLHVHNLHRSMRADRRRLLQCMLNLLSNAAKYTEKGSVTVQVRELPEAGGALVEIAVQDTGIGIRDEDRERIFHPFVRLDSPLRQCVPGAGLGLYLTRKLAAEVLQGEITFDSRFGGGSRFVIVLPAGGAAGG